MRKVASGVFVEDMYLAVHVGAVVTQDGLMLIDSPLKVEDARAWVTSLGEFGKPRYMALLDSHPDRVLGARGVSLRLIGHDWTRGLLSSWSDSYKGSANPIGAEADGLKRITGVRRAVPELSFSDEMRIHLGEREIHFFHRPGPTPGSIWVVVPGAKVAFIGDAVTVAEPPFLGNAVIEAWLQTLDDLRSTRFRSYKLVSARDGLIKRNDINTMARFLRKVPRRIQRMGERGEPSKTAAKLASQLVKSFGKIPPPRRERVMLRLQAGLTRLHSRLYPSDS
ncbi:MAG: MBL fold metallo-hydrolase [Anaerolineales bacterium]|nr:MBL fold metallo-hydrolase [Anaerolineales bacterium]